jgi:hypothetical protein
LEQGLSFGAEAKTPAGRLGRVFVIAKEKVDFRALWNRPQHLLFAFPITYIQPLIS